MVKPVTITSPPSPMWRCCNCAWRRRMMLGLSSMSAKMVTEWWSLSSRDMSLGSAPCSRWVYVFIFYSLNFTEVLKNIFNNIMMMMKIVLAHKLVPSLRTPKSIHLCLLSSQHWQVLYNPPPAPQQWLSGSCHQLPLSSPTMSPRVQVEIVYSWSLFVSFLELEIV